MTFSMNYPPYNFHSILWNSRERRDFFPDCGSLCGVHVNETGKATVQKEHNSCKGEHLYAKFSSLPLFQKPDVLQEHDAIGIHRLNYIKKKMTSLHKRLKIMKTLCHQDATWQIHLLEILKALHATEEANVTETSALKMFYANNYLRNFYEALGKFLDVQNVWHSNHKFIGGCLQTLNFSNQADSTISLAAITGPDFKTIKIITPKVNDSSLLNLDEKFVHKIKVNEEMFDLSCQTLYDTTYCLTRTVDKCFLFEISCDSDGDGISSSLKNTLHCEGKTYTSVNLSPYIVGECLVADHTNSVFLWDCNRSVQNVVNQHPHRFPCKSNWCNVHYASHPRSFVFTNQSAMELMDIRTSCRNPRDVFALPNKFLSKEERISASCCSQTNPFHHFVATDHGLFLIDERFLCHPVLQWQHMLEGIPHYLSPIQGAVQSSGDEVLLAASQYPNEAICVQYRTDPNHPPISMCSPWRISRPGDLYFIEKIINQIKDIVVHERLSDPIVGVAGEAINSEGMYVFQLNSLGDIFYQAYGVTNVYEDKTCSAGPGDSIVKHSEEIISISKNWLEHLENQLEEKYSQRMKARPTYEEYLKM
ncbi:Hypothetical predicted protein [Octopus vulgaris]|uniref:TAF1C beta-propeller domain-containing protein n=1 Tax=Octopus vulgaris TaxID=6645 RepID=A0AA36AJM6_OCTVU|nr:Hypothetical predicted protein [Octopus vulgaris]